MSITFPTNFQWGVATAAFQIEGGASLAGRKPSVWDTFSQQWRRSSRGHMVPMGFAKPPHLDACDHFHRYQEDVKLMAALGVTQYRFSISWCRIIPNGRGSVNVAGFEFYERLLDCLEAHGIEPVVTLFHWDSPLALENQYGSWRSREMADDFADYVTAVVTRLGDRIRHWITLNEITCFTHLGYNDRVPPEHAPGTIVPRWRDVWQTSHHALLAHGLGVQAIRAASPQPCRVGLVDNFGITVPLSETPANITAAQAAFPYHCNNGGLIYPAITGQYHAGFWKTLGAEAPQVQDGDLTTIHQPIDFLGLNIYTGSHIRAADNVRGYEYLDLPSGYPRLDMPWLNFFPDSLYWGIRHVSETLNRPDLSLIITENGCAAQDEVNAQGEVLDLDRILYLKQHLQGVARAITEDYPIHGYYLWSLLDNFEWSWAYAKRFGIVYINYQTQQRIPKASYYWYRDCIQAGKLL
ncbi:family 1 glycosylhydrolase [filamentous cyanobacterium LEGE 11480]|uniref:Family 1 glycosylhydrolase n=1 Tax=Romeriopsis navalis LEGE 11480 TaxID=2777977 RepID=A0A928Z1E1_9CYAN|nr:family 1 glycosylhydrolase [Romeriopsis navalis]MBE9028414.1 family 1 glycosylhydrolase [Romeriopsis navalis LEGE 11480]